MINHILVIHRNFEYKTNINNKYISSPIKHLQYRFSTIENKNTLHLAENVMSRDYRNTVRLASSALRVEVIRLHQL